MGKWMEQIDMAIPESELVRTDKADTIEAGFSSSVMSVPYPGVSGNLNKEEILPKVTIPTTDIADRENKPTPLSVVSVTPINESGKNLENINFSDTPISPTDKAARTPVSNFCQLVRHYGADHQRLLSYEEIMVELDADDIACLQHLDRHDKQIWAQLLADRLTRSKVWAAGLIPQRKNKRR
jgi:hypothetical protein